MACDELPDELPDDLKIPWKEAGMNGQVFSPSQLRAEADKMRSKMRRVYLALSFGCSTAVASYAFIIFNFHLFHNTLMLIGSSFSLVGFGYLVIYALVKRARDLPDLGKTDGLRFYRTELERKRDWMRGIGWRLPMIWVPVFLVDVGLTQLLLKESAFLAGVALSCGVFLLGLIGVWFPVRNYRMARKYQERIDALGSVARGAGQTDLMH
ncbi:MAG: hypothetical protein ACLQVL_22790 [Terriglobia bacterium]